jgi:hypothetical protein
MEGSVVKPAVWKMNLWRTKGTNNAERIARTRPRGDGLRRACAQSCMVDITARSPYKMWWMADGHRILRKRVCKASAVESAVVVASIIHHPCRTKLSLVYS